MEGRACEREQGWVSVRRKESVCDRLGFVSGRNNDVINLSFLFSPFLTLHICWRVVVATFTTDTECVAQRQPTPTRQCKQQETMTTHSSAETRQEKARDVFLRRSAKQIIALRFSQLLPLHTALSLMYIIFMPIYNIYEPSLRVHLCIDHEHTAHIMEVLLPNHHEQHKIHVCQY